MPSWLDNVLSATAVWLADHSFPALAGFVAGILGAEARERWARRKEKRPVPDAKRD